MNTIKAFFKQDNATAKLSGWLILIASLITMAGQHFHFPAETYLVVTLIAGALTTAAGVFQKNKVITWSLAWLLLYSIITYLSTNLTQVWPEAQTFVAFLGGAIKIVTEFSQHKSTDTDPPTTITK